MRKLLVFGLALAVVALAGHGGFVTAAEGPADDAVAAKNTVQVTLTGKNYCIETALKKGGKAPKLGIDACRHALKVTEAKDADGNIIADMAGWTLYYLFSETSQPLSSDDQYFGKTVAISGMVYRNERALDVATVELKDGGVAEVLEGDKDEFDFADFDYSAGGGSASTQK